MPTAVRYGLEQARKQLPTIVSQAQAGIASVITRHGKPFAAVVSVGSIEPSDKSTSILDLRGSGAGLWNASTGQSIDQLRSV